MILGDSLWSNTSNGTLELVPRRILELVGDFCRAKNPGFGLGRTGLTGRRDRSDRWCDWVKGDRSDQSGGPV